MSISLSNIIGNGPVFSATGTGTLSLTQNTLTKVTFGVKTFDTNSNYNNSTYNFTPTVAGYYQINAAAYFSFGSSNGSIAQLILYKGTTGSQVAYQYGNVLANSTTSNIIYITNNFSSIIYMNGTSDSISIYVSASTIGGTGTRILSLDASFFNGSLVSTLPLI